MFVALEPSYGNPAPQRPTHRACRRFGFALVLTLSLMALLLLLLLSIASLIRVDQQAASNQMKRVAAKQNALLGLQVSLGRLQRLAGSDTRATAAAELFADASSLNGIDAPLEIANQRWIGVFDAGQAGAASDGPVPDPFDAASHPAAQAALDARSKAEKMADALGWLVSGDPDAPLDPSEAVPEADSVILFSAKADPDDASIRAEAVRASWEVVDTPGAPEGRFAYWVDDLSLKANANIPQPHARPDPPDDADAVAGLPVPVYRSAALAQTVNPTFLDDRIDEADFTAAIDHTGNRLGTALGLSQLSFLYPDTELPASRFHETTSTSFSLLTDPLRGGLKQDLSLLFNGIADAAPPETLEGIRRYPTERLPETLQPGSNEPYNTDAYLFALRGLDLEDPRGGPDGTGILRGPRLDVLLDLANLHRIRPELQNNAAILPHRPEFFEEVSSSGNGVRETKKALNIRPLPNPAGSGLRYETIDLMDWYKAMIFEEAIQDSGQGEAWLVEPEVENRTAKLHPIITEVFLVLSVGFVDRDTYINDLDDRYQGGGNPDETTTENPQLSDSVLVLRVHPVVELHNPYNVAIEAVDSTLVLQDFGPVLDFRFSDKVPTADPAIPETQTYSAAFDQPWNSGALFIGRKVGHLAFADQGVVAGRTAPGTDFGVVPPLPQIVLRLLENDFGGTLQAGETRSFVMDAPNQKTPTGAYLLSAGDNWEAGFVEIGVRAWRVEENASISGATRTTAVYEGLWPDGTQLDDYRRLEVEAVVGRTTANHKISGSLGLDIAPTQMRFYWRTPFQQNRWLQAGVVPATDDSIELSGSDDFRRTDTFLRFAGESWASTGNAPINHRIVALGFKQKSAEEWEADSALPFLASNNPAAPLQSFSGGGEALLEAPGMELEILGTVQDLNIGDRIGKWGVRNGSGTPESFVLFELPKTAPLSIGDLGRANLAAYSGEPVWPLGGATVPPQLAATPERPWRYRFPEEIDLSWDTGGRLGYDNPYLYQSDYSQTFNALKVDLSYYLNARTWDRFFFSTIDPAKPVALGPENVLPNSRMLWHGSKANSADLSSEAYDEIAANLVINGGFNVNNASPRAWAAILGAMCDLSVRSTEGDLTSLDYGFPRFSHPVEPGGASEPWSGLRALSREEIEDLGEAIAIEVRNRGPFLNLGHFINRQLVDGPRGHQGAIQAAIERADLNASAPAFAHQSLIQQDVLRALAATLTTRGDTFRIRVAGESGAPPVGRRARAYLEATVQRRYTFVDPTDPPEAATAELSPTNRRFGRRFEIIDLRWLNEEEL